MINHCQKYPYLFFHLSTNHASEISKAANGCQGTVFSEFLSFPPPEPPSPKMLSLLNPKAETIRRGQALQVYTILYPC